MSDFQQCSDNKMHSDGTKFKTNCPIAGFYRLPYMEVRKTRQEARGYPISLSTFHVLKPEDRYRQLFISTPYCLNYTKSTAVSG